MHTTSLRFALAWLFLPFLPFHAVAQELTNPSSDSAKVVSTNKNEERTWFLSGSASEQYWFRYANNLELLEIDTAGELVARRSRRSETDNDLRLLLDGYLWEKTDRFAADLSMGVAYDLDGAPAVGRPSSFASANDDKGSRNWLDPYDVYSLYGEYHTPGLLALTRAGRQSSEYGRPVTFDGATAKLRLMKPYLDLAIFGGRTVHFFESGRDLFEDWLTSMAITVRPFPFLRVEIDYRYVSQDTTTRDPVKDHSYGLALWYRTSDLVRLKGYVRALNAAASNAGGSARFEWSDIQLGIDADIDGQLTTLRNTNESDNPYFDVLGKSLPYLRVGSSIWKKITNRFGTYGADLGWQERLITKGESTQLNRSYGRAYLLLEAVDIAISGPFATFVVEYNYVPNHSDLASHSLVAVGGSAGYERKPIKATVGSRYYRYKYDYYADLRELENVRSYFGEVSYEPYKWLSICLFYAFERFNRDIHTVKLTVSETF
jgi:hypothetical protein